MRGDARGVVLPRRAEKSTVASYHGVAALAFAAASAIAQPCGSPILKPALQ
jgi:hypothetical protein